jgi:hypothetical protein
MEQRVEDILARCFFAPPNGFYKMYTLNCSNATFANQPKLSISILSFLPLGSSIFFLV